MENNPASRERIENQQLDRQVERSAFFTHTELGRITLRIKELESFLYGLIDTLLVNEIVGENELSENVELVRKEMQEKNEFLQMRVAMRIDEENEPPTPVVNCEERLHICKAVCCKLNFALSVDELESGKAKWDLGQPYFIRHEKTGYCTHLDCSNNTCGIYHDRPRVCVKYSCAGDQRIWKDFDKMVLNQDWIDENLQEKKTMLKGIFMSDSDQIVYKTKADLDQG